MHMSFLLLFRHPPTPFHLPSRPSAGRPRAKFCARFSPVKREFFLPLLLDWRIKFSHISNMKGDVDVVLREDPTGDPCSTGGERLIAKWLGDMARSMEDSRDLFTAWNWPHWPREKRFFPEAGVLNLKCEARWSPNYDSLKAKNMVVMILQIDSSRILKENISTTRVTLPVAPAELKAENAKLHLVWTETCGSWFQPQELKCVYLCL